MQDSNNKELFIHDMPWLVVNDTEDHAYVAAGFLNEICAESYVEMFRSNKIGNYFVCHRSELNDKYKVYARSAVNM